MPTLRQYPVFICHDWEYGDDYSRIEDFLNDAPNFRWKNLSVPEHDPLDTDDQLEYNLRNQMRPAEIMLVLGGMYTSRSRWMDFEMNFARRIGKPIIGIAPWGARVLPLVVQNNAVEIVGWQRQSIVDAIRRNAP